MSFVNHVRSCEWWSCKFTLTQYSHEQVGVFSVIIALFKQMCSNCFFFFPFYPYNILQILLILSRTEAQVWLFAPKPQHLMTKYQICHQKKKREAKQDDTIGKKIAREISSRTKNFKKKLAVKELQRKTVLPSSHVQKSKSQNNQ